MRKTVFGRWVLLATFVMVGALGTPSQAGIFDILKNEAKNAAEREARKKVQEETGINTQCASLNLRYSKACMRYTAQNAAVRDFRKVLSGEDLSTQQSNVMATIYTGEPSSWSNPDTGASGTSTVVKEKTKTKKKKIPVLKDQVETVPELDLIGENYRATAGSNVRGGPGTEFGVVSQLNTGDVVNVVGQVVDADWYLIGQGGVGTGYVFKDLLTPAPTQTETSADAPEGEVAKVKTKTTQTCKTIEQVVTLENGKEKKEKITACQGPNGWEIV